MAINKLKTTSIETDAITADLLATGAITVADITDGEITAEKLHTTLDFSTKTFTMHNNHVAQAMVTQHQTQLAIGADQIDSGSPTFGGNVTVTGNLTVNGTQTVLNTETLTVDDNIIVLNNNEVGTPSQNAGLEIERGTSTNVEIRWNETVDKWQFTNDGTNYIDLGSGYTNVDVDAHLNQSTANTGEYLSWNGTDYDWASVPSDIVTDTTPQLGGNLDVNGKDIVSSSDGHIEIKPNGSGDIHLVTSTGVLRINHPSGGTDVDLGSHNMFLNSDSTTTGTSVSIGMHPGTDESPSVSSYSFLRTTRTSNTSADFTINVANENSPAQSYYVTKFGGNDTLGSVDFPGDVTLAGHIKMSAVQQTNTNANMNILYQHNDDYIHGGSGLLWNPAEDMLKVNGNSIGANIFLGSGAGPLVLAVGNYSSTNNIKISDKIQLTGPIITPDAGTDNTRLGQNAGDSIITGADKNTTIGYNAGTAITSGNWNTCIGTDAGKLINTGQSNVMIGQGAGIAVADTNDHIMIGRGAMTYQNNTQPVIAIGTYAGIWATGWGNVIMGYLAGYANGQPNYLSAGAANTLLGNYANVGATNDSYSTVIGYSTTGKGNYTGMLGATGGVYQGNNSSSWSTTSDLRLKKNIVDSTIGLAEINQLQVRNFEYRTEEEITAEELDARIDVVDVSGVQVGVIAQEIQAILPKCVVETSQGVLTVDTDNLTWHLIKAVQELSAKNDVLQDRITALEGA